MADHYRCIGFAFEHPGEQLIPTIQELMRGASPATGPLGLRDQWVDSSGAEVLAFFAHEKGAGACSKPAFAGSPGFMGRVDGIVQDPDGCAFCAAAHVWITEDGEDLFPVAIELDDIHLGAPEISDRSVPIAIAAFVDSLEVAENEAAYNERVDAQRSDQGQVPMASRALIPIGLFPDRRYPSSILATGIVLASETRSNAHTGVEFRWGRVATLGGELDVVAPIEGPTFDAGNVIRGKFWLVGHIDRRSA